MKTKKIISLFAAVAMVATMFSSLVAFAAPAANSNPAITGTVKTVDGDGYAIMQFKLTNNETLSYSLNRGKVTSNGINAIQVKLTLDEEVFDVSESYISGGFTGVNVLGDGIADKTFVFASTSVDSYMTTVPEYLFQVDALLKAGYTVDNIPEDAVKFTDCKVEYTSYDNVATSAGATTYTIYGCGEGVLTKDYTLTVGLDDTFKSNTPAGPTFTDDTQTTMAKDAEKVNADGTYNVGVKADAIVVPAGSTATKIKFGFTTDDATALRTTASYPVTLPTEVQAGAVSVALNVTSVPDGVTLTYTGATVE